MELSHQRRGDTRDSEDKVQKQQLLSGQNEEQNKHTEQTVGASVRGSGTLPVVSLPSLPLYIELPQARVSAEVSNNLVVHVHEEPELEDEDHQRKEQTAAAEDHHDDVADVDCVQRGRGKVEALAEKPEVHQRLDRCIFLRHQHQVRCGQKPAESDAKQALPLLTQQP